MKMLRIVCPPFYWAPSATVLMGRWWKPSKEADEQQFWSIFEVQPEPPDSYVSYKLHTIRNLFHIVSLIDKHFSARLASGVWTESSWVDLLTVKCHRDRSMTSRKPVAFLCPFLQTSKWLFLSAEFLTSPKRAGFYFLLSPLFKSSVYSKEASVSNVKN